VYISTEERFRQCDILRKDPSVFLKKKKAKEEGENELETCCQSGMSFLDTSSSGSLSTTSTYSTSTSPTYSDIRGKKKKPVKRLDLNSSSGDKVTVSSVLPSSDINDKIAKSDESNTGLTKNFLERSTKPKPFISEDHEAKIQFELVELNENFTLDSKQSLRGRKVQSNPQITEEYVPGSGYFRPITHPSTHPSLVQPRTKLEAGTLSEGSEPLNAERQQELHTLLQQWVEEQKRVKATITTNNK